MADTLKVYKGGEVVGSAERGVDGIAKVTIDSLTADTDYAAGLYQVAFSNENGESEKVNVPAFKTKPIPVTSVKLDKSTLSLEEGATGNLVATIAPSNASYKAVSYKSSDDTVATVDNTGKVTAVKAGTADITVESVADGSKTAKCELTVTAKPTTTTTTTAKPTTTTTTTVAPTTTTTTAKPTTTTTTTAKPTTTTTTTEPTTTTTSTSSTTTSTTTEPTTTTTTTVEPTTTTTTSTEAPTTTTTTTEGTTTTTTTLDPSDPSDVPDAESEVPNVEL